MGSLTHTHVHTDPRMSVDEFTYTYRLANSRTSACVYDLQLLETAQHTGEGVPCDTQYYGLYMYGWTYHNTWRYIYIYIYGWFIEKTARLQLQKTCEAERNHTRIHYTMTHRYAQKHRNT